MTIVFSARFELLVYLANTRKIWYCNISSAPIRSFSLASRNCQEFVCLLLGMLLPFFLQLGRKLPSLCSLILKEILSTHNSQTQCGNCPVFVWRKLHSRCITSIWNTYVYYSHHKLHYRNSSQISLFLLFSDKPNTSLIALSIAPNKTNTTDKVNRMWREFCHFLSSTFCCLSKQL